jgi:23S rRNA pseudouridine955/2504/2580 synthase
MRKVQVSAAMANQKIEKFLRKYLSDVTLSTIYKVMRQKDVKVNGVRINKDYVVKENDMVEIYLPESKEGNVKEEIVKTGKHFDVVYEDENVIFVNKYIGTLVQKDISNQISLTEEVQYYLYQKGEYNPNDSQGFAPSPAHRLDRNTCGIVMFGKKVESLKILTDLLKNRTGIVKKYKALVFNRVKEDGVVNLRLVKNSDDNFVKIASPNDKDSLSAETEYHVLSHYQNTSLLEIILHSGRTHQIRAHMAAIGHPLVGDTKYGDFKLNKEFEKKYKFSNQFLQAYQLSFQNIDGMLSYLSNRTFTVKLVKEYEDLLKELRE